MRTPRCSGRCRPTPESPGGRKLTSLSQLRQITPLLIRRLRIDLRASWTLAATLLRFRAPTAGRISVDGVDYWEYSPESWHRATALVEQDAFLFHGTLRENIVYGCATATDAAIERAIQIANLADVVAGMPNGLDTLVGERGAMVSGGQRQRIAIARAVIRDPAILILDEATSHLDAVSEQLV